MHKYHVAQYWYAHHFFSFIMEIDRKIKLLGLGINKIHQLYPVFKTFWNFRGKTLFACIRNISFLFYLDIRM